MLAVTSGVIAALACTSFAAQEPPTKFQAALLHARDISTLAAPGAAPFHLKLSTTDTTTQNPEYAGEIEIWWAAPDQWRREVKLPAFTQTAVRSGESYYETNSSDYLPYWVHELLRAAIDPIPVTELFHAPADEDRLGCENWETEYGAGEEKFSIYNSVCFNPNGTANKIFGTPIAVQLEDYEAFDEKWIARKIRVSPGGRSDVTATVTLLEPLAPASTGNGVDGAERFAVPHDTGFTSRLRFEQVPESVIATVDSPPNPEIAWPATYTFPVSGVIAVTVKIDRAGNVRELPSAISKNQRINGMAIEQIRNWKFKPYRVDGAPVEVVTTISVPFHMKYEPLGANGKSFPEISFRQHMLQSLALSDPRVPGGKRFVLHGRFALADKRTGEYEEICGIYPGWIRLARMDGVSVGEVGEKDGTIKREQKPEGATAPPELDLVLQAMKSHFPEPRTFQEADWGNSAVPLSNIDPTLATTGGEPELIRAGRGSVAPNNQPVSGQDYWFDSAGLLRADFVAPNTTVYSDFQTWNEKQIPRQIEVFRSGKLLVTIHVTSIDTH